MFKFKEFMLIISVTFAVIILIYGIVFFNNPLTGKVSFKLDSNYKQGQTLDGVLKISLKEGELIPASSKIILENNGRAYEYELSKLVSDNSGSGEFYVEGKSFSGTGEGYGIEGEKIIYPKVDFTLEVFSKSNSSNFPNILNTSDKNKENVNVSVVIGTVNNSKNKTQEQATNEAKTNENISKEIVKDEIVQEKIIPEKESKPVEKVQEKEQETPKKNEEPKQQEPKAISKEKTSRVEETTSAEPKPTITGNIISGFFSKTFNFFLGMTGKVSLKLKNEVKGEVSFDKEFVYELREGQTAKILSGSVKTNSKELSNGEIDLNIEGNKVIVTTTYSKTEKGFGQDYVGNNTKKILFINLSKLNFIPKQGDLKISLVYGNETIVSLKTSLVEGKISTENKTIKTEVNLTNITLVNVTESNMSIVNITENNITIIKVSSNLTKAERDVLVNEFGNVSVEITKAEKTPQGTIVRFEINNFWVEHSYDSEISDEKLKKQVKEDRIKFLKDLSKKFSQQGIQKQEIKGIIGNYSI